MATERSAIEHLLDIAVQAPSGDNAQPWQFKIEDDTIYIINEPGKDATLYNFEERGSYLAHGAIIENICVAGPTLGYSVRVELFPQVENCVARIVLTQTTPIEDILAINIPKRCTNRKPYIAKRPLEESDKDGLMASLETGSLVKLYYAPKDKVPELSQIVSLNERLLFENRELHDFLFGMIRWNRKEEAQAPGLYVKTMEFPLPLQILLRYVLSDFATVEALNSIGLSRLIPSQSAKVYKSSSAFFALAIPDTKKENYVLAGRAVQRFWLTAEKQGLNVQPVAGIPYLAERVRAGQGAMFSKEHQEAILEADTKIAKILGVGESERIAMLFRVGYGSNPTAKSLKFSPKILE